MISHLITLLCMVVLDSVIGALFPYDTSYVSMSLVPSLAFLTLAIQSRRISFRQSLMLAFVLGVSHDIFVNHTFFLYSSVYVFVIAFVHLWSKSISSSIFEEVLFAVTTLFVKELALYFIMTISTISQLSLLQWFWKREVLTLIVHSFASLFVFRIVAFLEQYLENQDEMRRKGENVKWLQLRLKEEKKHYR